MTHSYYQCPDCDSREHVTLATNDNVKRSAFECGACGCYWEEQSGIIMVQTSARKLT